MQIIIRSFWIVLFFGLSQLQAQQTTGQGILATADSLARNVLENEGLHTIYGGLKPISTVTMIDYAIDSVSQEFIDPVAVKQELSHLQQSLNFLENKEIGYVIVPFKNVYDKFRTYEILVYNRKAVSRKIEEYEGFFLKRGVFPDTPAERVLTLYEFGERYERYTAYGHFFGYPRHAVDFFVSASKEYEETEKFVTRDFYQLPVVSGQDGRFVYAVPKGHLENEADLLIKETAAKNVAAFLELKDQLTAQYGDNEKISYLEIYLESVTKEYTNVPMESMLSIDVHSDK